ncbi:XRE family transcriptional regulator [Psychromonas sp. psych-6C06]|uniref:LexA family protein n=1 Tax=Psychromonas sp. psych-6C06 TaxID=2058089 RepID=UPI000C342240|nr:S24 family peptidase [Psychromonas sp. psych-6C06]PKF60640.1 XRE family transcriptional regulator [Psychromonas sp. psych-6C06]
MDISKRIKDRRKDIGLSQEELAERVGVSQNAIHKLEDGTTKKPRKIFELAKVLKCDPEWLLNGIAPKHSESNLITPINKLSGLYPLIDWVQAGNFTAIAEIHPSDAEHYPCPVKCSDQTFLLKVRGQSMAGTFNEGELIFVDPEVEAINGKYVVARLDDENEATLKQLIIEGGERYLKATNPDWPNKILPINGNCTIVGVVVFAGRLF